MCQRYTDQLHLACPQVGTWPTTQACTLDFPVHKSALNPLSHTSQGHLLYFLFPAVTFVFSKSTVPLFLVVSYFLSSLSFISANSKHGCFIMYLLIRIYNAYENIFHCLLFLLGFTYVSLYAWLFLCVVSVFEKLFVGMPKMKEHFPGNTCICFCQAPKGQYQSGNNPN